MVFPSKTSIAVGSWRTHNEPMQVVSGRHGKEIIHFEAPPSTRVKKEMNIPHIIRLGISRKILKRDLLQRRLFKKRVDGIIVNARALKDELLDYSFVRRNIKKDNIIAVYNGYQFPRVKSRKKLKSKKIILNKMNVL